MDFLCRAVVVYRSDAEVSELDVLLRGAVGASDSESEDGSLPLIAMRKAYYNLMSSSEVLPVAGVRFRDRYGLRDFYHLGRYFARRRVDCGHFPSFVAAVERNFSGLPREDFDTILLEFTKQFCDFEAKGTQPDRMLDVTAMAKLAVPGVRRPVLDVLRDSLSDVIVDETQLNDSIVRYQLLLDETADDSGVRLLFQCGVVPRDSTVVIDLSSFADDTNDVFRSMVISRIKHYMAQPVTVLLMHTASLHGSLYDLLNQHFSSLVVDNKPTFYANVAIGSYSKPCLVRNNFCHPAAILSVC